MGESSTPWKENRWLPGVLNFEQMHSLIKCGLITGTVGKIDPDASAIDLHLTEEVFEMVKGSLKPFDKQYSNILHDIYYAKSLTNKENDNTFILKKGHCYVIKIKEKLHPAIVNSSPFYGQATAKSSIGRVDVIARLIVDGMKEYEKFSPKEVTSGEMFLEVTPITFDVKIKEGISISQLRFCNGDFDDSIITDEDFIESILNLSHHSKNPATLSVDISNYDFNSTLSAAAYCAKSEKNKTPIELWGEKKYDIGDFWDTVKSHEKQNVKSLTIENNSFYILRSAERISLPSGVCIYCRAMDETLGEMRIHYAGFVHPLFGLNRPDNVIGTPLIFEVRGHNVNVLLTQGEILARLFFYRMSCVAQTIKKDDPGENKSIDTISNAAYGDQELKLSKFFKSS
jgi:dCTP deaminase